jgi:hypothetical protein
MDARSRNKNIFTYLVYVHRIYRLISQLIITLPGVALAGLQLPLHPVQQHPGWGYCRTAASAPYMHHGRADHLCAEWKRKKFEPGS